MPCLSQSPTFQPEWRLFGSGSVTTQLFPASVHSLSGCTLPLCICHFVLILPSDFKNTGPSWCCSNLVWQRWEGLTWLSPKNPAADLVGTGPGAVATLVPALVPGTVLSRSTLLTVWFFNVLYSFGLQAWDMLGYHWLFTLFLRKSASCSTAEQGEVDSAPTYVTNISWLFLLYTNMTDRYILIFILLFYWLLFLKILFTFGVGGREKQKERNINVWLPLAHPLLWTWLATQPCALTGNWRRDSLFHWLALNPLSHTSQGYWILSIIIFSFFWIIKGFLFLM